MTTDGTPDPACTFRPAPSCETTANHAQTPARPQFHPGHRATKWPIFSLVAQRLGVASLIVVGLGVSDGIKVLPASVVELSERLA